MNDATRGTLLEIPLVKERYVPSFIVSLFLHVLLVLLFVVAPLLFPKPKPILLGTGPGGGSGGEQYTVGVADELGGGEGMIKPSLIPQPPPLPEEKPVKEEVKEEAVPLPQTVEPKKPAHQPEEKSAKPAAKKNPEQTSNVIPTAPKPGAGGTGGPSGGAGGGRGGGGGVQIGSGTGGLGDSWYARAVESRIGSNWVKPQITGRIEIVYSFLITNEGQIRDVKKEKSCGNEMLDLTAERAIRASNPLPPLPLDLRGRPVQFIAQFIYPPSP